MGVDALPWALAGAALWSLPVWAQQLTAFWCSIDRALAVLHLLPTPLPAYLPSSLPACLPSCPPAWVQGEEKRVVARHEVGHALVSTGG